ncbi:MAG: mechanosensitive ion channel domain-containing protein [Cyanobacteria bacterium P01_A01_bin.84]
MTFSIDKLILFGLINIFVASTIIFSFFIPKIYDTLKHKNIWSNVKEYYEGIIAPYKYPLELLLILSIIDINILIIPLPKWFNGLELILGLSISLGLIWYGFKIFNKYFDTYWLNAALQKNRKLNSEILILTKFFIYSLILLIIVFLFAETHQINLIGLIASLGVGSLAIAFAAQKTLEQLLGGIVIYIDRPFVVDDYIHLPDGTLGRVESIGWRSTKIRTSGKGSLVIIPNNVLTQTTIENLTDAKKVISLIYITFYRHLLEEEKALIRQVILNSTQDIFGIDHRITQINFKELPSDTAEKVIQAQVTLFVLGTGDMSMELRTQLLEIARQNITKQLKNYGILFDFEEKTINVISPVNI